MMLLISPKPKSSSYTATAHGLCALSFYLSAFAFVTPALGSQEREINGFYGISWGARLDGIAGLRLIESGDRIQTYELKNGPPRLGDTKVDVMQLVAIGRKFARVSIRYSGEQNHRHMLAYLQMQFGPIEQIPGSMIRGLTQQFSWRTDDTEVSLTYRSYQQRGTVYIESRTLAPRFNDVLPDSAY